MENTLVILVTGLIMMGLWIMARDLGRTQGDLGGHLHLDPGTEHTWGVGHDGGWGGCDFGGDLGGDVGCW